MRNFVLLVLHQRMSANRDNNPVTNYALRTLVRVCVCDVFRGGGGMAER